MNIKDKTMTVVSVFLVGAVLFAACGPIDLSKGNTETDQNQISEYTGTISQNDVSQGEVDEEAAKRDYVRPAEITTSKNGDKYGTWIEAAGWIPDHGTVYNMVIICESKVTKLVWEYVLFDDNETISFWNRDYPEEFTQFVNREGPYFDVVTDSDCYRVDAGDKSDFIEFVTYMMNKLNYYKEENIDVMTQLCEAISAGDFSQDLYETSNAHYHVNYVDDFNEEGHEPDDIVELTDEVRGALSHDLNAVLSGLEEHEEE